MLPIPTNRSVLTGIAGVLLLLHGVLTSFLLSAAFGASLLSALSFAFAATYSLARRTRRRRLEFAWWREKAGRGAITAQSELLVRCYLRHRGDKAIRVRSLEVSAAAHCQTELLDIHGDLLLSPAEQHEFRILVVPPAAGRHVLQGLAITIAGPLSLFQAALYFPNPLAMTVWPALAPRPLRLREQRKAPLTAEGRGRFRRRGPEGTEFRELREWLPGDPFRSISWKASARRNELLVRLTETEPTLRRWLILDVSGTMRDGPPGQRRLDNALSNAARHIVDGIRADDTVGLLAVDGRITHHLPPGRGPSQRIRLLEALMDLPDMNDPDLSAADQDDVLELVGRYLLGQYGYDYSNGPTSWNREGILAQIRHTSGGGAQPGWCSNNPDTALRSYCRHRGITVPYRQAPIPGSKEDGIGAAIELASRDRETSSITVMTDFEGVEDFRSITTATRTAHRRHHLVSFVVPTSPGAEPTVASEFATRLRIPFEMAETRRLRISRNVLRSVGAQVETGVTGSARLGSAGAPVQGGGGE